MGEVGDGRGVRRQCRTRKRREEVREKRTGERNEGRAEEADVKAGG